MALDMPEPREFACHDSCQKGFLRAHRGVDLVPHLVVGLVLQVGDAESFFSGTWSRKPPSSSQNQQAGSLSYS